MLLLLKRNHSIFYWFLLIMVLGCANPDTSPKNTKSFNADKKDSAELMRLSCFNLRAVFEDARHLDGDTFFWPGYNPNFKISTSSVKSFLRNSFLRGQVKFDSSLKYITSFGYQAEILINDNCHEKLGLADESFLQQVYFPLQPKPLGQYKFSPVSFEKSEARRIFNMGDAEVYEYKLKAADVSPHFLHIIIKEANEPNEDDGFYRGIVICSNGIIWKKVNNYSIPFFSGTLDSSGFVSPLYFDGKRFIPTAVFSKQSLDTLTQ